MKKYFSRLSVLLGTLGVLSLLFVGTNFTGGNTGHFLAVLSGTAKVEPVMYKIYDVKSLQEFLVAKKYLDSSDADGYYGDETLIAVGKLQKERGLSSKNLYLGIFGGSWTNNAFKKEGAIISPEFIVHKDNQKFEWGEPCGEKKNILGACTKKTECKNKNHTCQLDWCKCGGFVKPQIPPSNPGNPPVTPPTSPPGVPVVTANSCINQAGQCVPGKKGERCIKGSDGKYLDSSTLCEKAIPVPSKFSGICTPTAGGNRCKFIGFGAANNNCDVTKDCPNPDPKYMGGESCGVVGTIGAEKGKCTNMKACELSTQECVPGQFACFCKNKKQVSPPITPTTPPTPQPSGNPVAIDYYGKCNTANQCVKTGGTGIPCVFLKNGSKSCPTEVDYYGRCNAANQCVRTGGTGISCAKLKDGVDSCNL